MTEAIAETEIAIHRENGDGPGEGAGSQNMGTDRAPPVRHFR